MKKILDKNFKKPITCLTAYSSSIAKILNGNVDLVLIGDSLGTTLYGMKNVRGVTLDMMKVHGLAVTKNIDKSITVIDMPYKTYENKSEALKNAKELIKYTNAKMLKIEINKKNLEIIKHLSSRNLNVIAHIGVTPQSFKDFKKIKVAGQTKREANDLIYLALEAEKLGAKAVLLECVSQKTAKKITSSLLVPTIGIGSSQFCDGQILVFDDLIIMDKNQHMPKFVKSYLDFESMALKAIKNFSREVKEKKFPNKNYSYQ